MGAAPAGDRMAAEPDPDLDLPLSALADANKWVRALIRRGNQALLKSVMFHEDDLVFPGHSSCLPISPFALSGRTYDVTPRFWDAMGDTECCLNAHGVRLGNTCA